VAIFTNSKRLSHDFLDGVTADIEDNVDDEGFGVELSDMVINIK